MTRDDLLARLYAACLESLRRTVSSPDAWRRGYVEGRVAGVALAWDVLRGER